MRELRQPSAISGLHQETDHSSNEARGSGGMVSVLGKKQGQRKALGPGCQNILFSMFSPLINQINVKPTLELIALFVNLVFKMLAL